MSLDRSVGHGVPNCLHYVTVGTHVLRAELRADAALHVVSAQRQERHKAGDEPLLNDAGVEEATCREKGRQTDRQPSVPFIGRQRNLQQRCS